MWLGFSLNSLNTTALCSYFKTSGTQSARALFSQGSKTQRQKTHIDASNQFLMVNRSASGLRLVAAHT
jgi:hypothetical protein